MSVDRTAAKCLGCGNNILISESFSVTNGGRVIGYVHRDPPATESEYEFPCHTNIRLMYPKAVIVDGKSPWARKTRLPPRRASRTQIPLHSVSA